TLGLGFVVVGLLQLLAPMRVVHLLAFLPQALSMYLLFCVIANALSILAPLPIAPGAFRPSGVKGVALLLQFAFLFVFPTVMMTTLLPLGIELLLTAFHTAEGVPVCLILSLLECAAVVVVYLVLVNLEGRWLHAREQHILKVVAGKAE